MDVQFITKHKVRSSVDTLSFVYALIHIRWNCLLELFNLVDYLNYRRYSGAFYLSCLVDRSYCWHQRYGFRYWESLSFRSYRIGCIIVCHSFRIRRPSILSLITTAARKAIYCHQSKYWWPKSDLGRTRDIWWVFSFVVHNVWNCPVEPMQA